MASNPATTERLQKMRNLEWENIWIFSSQWGERKQKSVWLVCRCHHTHTDVVNQFSISEKRNWLRTWALAPLPFPTTESTPSTTSLLAVRAGLDTNIDIGVVNIKSLYLKHWTDFKKKSVCKLKNCPRKRKIILLQFLYLLITLFLQDLTQY